VAEITGMDIVGVDNEGVDNEGACMNWRLLDLSNNEIFTYPTCI